MDVPELLLHTQVKMILLNAIASYTDSCSGDGCYPIVLQWGLDNGKLVYDCRSEHNELVDRILYDLIVSAEPLSDSVLRLKQLQSAEANGGTISCRWDTGGTSTMSYSFALRCFRNDLSRNFIAGFMNLINAESQKPNATEESVKALTKLSVGPFQNLIFVMETHMFMMVTSFLQKRLHIS